MRATRIRLDDLPLFAGDHDLAVAIVGSSFAEKWRTTRLPALEKMPGFPKVDTFHGGRPVELIKRFYRTYLGVAADLPSYGPPDGPEGTWKKPRPTSRLKPSQPL